ncbi:uncharacterized protein N7479_010097 [Penicillium vulpinum]|uniref:(S)-ureidoglycine aminohydrolase cupin domain-containing protein n=1 Tax=Penicillium vulpinum TaxID=29845 RepID=A0A1V6RUY0_9EURO|nr:uncharacterized protein N7479_010097 [Penicillium vulpinum]KAJ5951684.1 hypothetical protein N7479_010097 [Penicillium vulpinum]OQE05587.1 hypothetical protein PENVUL_c023G02229 [Penicillium vulpinum]
MPKSQSNLTGSDKPNTVAYGKWDSFSWEPFPEWEGTKAIMFRSSDGKRVAGAFRESATASMTYTCDEFTYVTAGWIKAHVHGGDTFTLKVGDCVYFTKGQTVDFECSKDYANVSAFFGTEPVTIV